jgi:hypothetical protein
MVKVLLKHYQAQALCKSQNKTTLVTLLALAALKTAPEKAAMSSTAMDTGKSNYA